MIPVLYEATETQFNHMGIGALADTISCLVHEARNGAFELTLNYPVDGPLYAELLEDRIIKAKANDNANMDDQLFRIYKSGKPLNGQCTFYAEHITGELAKNPITHVSVTNGTAQQFGQAILANTIYPHRFSFVSSDSTIASSDLSRVPAAQALVGIEGSLIDRWRGELTRDNFVIHEEQNRGEDTGITIEYGKNLTDATQEKAIDETYTSIYPYATIQVPAGEGDSAATESQVIELPEKIIESPYVGNYAYGRCLPIDLSGDDVTDEASLRSKAQAYVTQNDFGKPKVSLTINFVQLWQMEEYKNVAPLEHVNLCDWVTVRFKKLGIDSKVKVIDGVFDSRVEKWVSMELGDAKTDWQSSIQSSITDVSSTANQAAKVSGYALTQANGKNKTYFSATEPTGNLVSGDLWYKIVNGQYTEMWRYNGIAWDKILSADANDALNKAIDALTAANGKNTVYHQAAQPIAANNQDIWFRKNADGTVTIFVYQDGQWTNPIQDGVKAAQDQADTAVATADAASQQVGALQTTVQQDYATKSSLTQTATSLQTNIDAKVDTDTYNSKISQLSNDINARVVKNDVVHQINISTEGILIDGSKTHITGQTTIDNAVITNAMIASIDIGKATTGTLDANRIGAKSVTVDKLDVANLAAISANLGAVTAGNITASTYTTYGVDSSGYVAKLVISPSGTQFPLIISTENDPYAHVLRATSDGIYTSTVSSATSSTNPDGHSITYWSWAHAGVVELKSYDNTTNNIKNVAELSDHAVDFHPSDGSHTYIDALFTGLYTDKACYANSFIFPADDEKDSGLYWTANGISEWRSNNVYRIRVTPSNVFIGGGAMVNVDNQLHLAGGQGIYWDQSNANVYANNLSGLDFVTGSYGVGMYMGVDGGGTHILHLTQDLQAGGWAYAGNFVNTSRVELKQDITAIDDNIGLSLVNSLDIYKFKYKKDVADGRAKFVYGGIIGDGYCLPDEFKDFNEQGVNLYSSTFIGLKAIQELTKLHQEDLLKIAELEQRISLLEGAAA